jgi:pre-mRNA-splicing factor CWC26
MMDNEDDGAGRMESGARGGLQTAAQTAAMVKAQDSSFSRFSSSARRASARFIATLMIRPDASR